MMYCVCRSILISVSSIAVLVDDACVLTIHAHVDDVFQSPDRDLRRLRCMIDHRSELQSMQHSLELYLFVYINIYILYLYIYIYIFREHSG